MSFQARTTRTYAEVDVTKKLIDKANSVDIVSIFAKYGINVDSYIRKITCPLISHNGGKERTASFCYYPENNNFYCFGCKASGKPVDFVSLTEGVSIYKAAQLILDNFEVVQQDTIEPSSNQYKLHLEFSHLMRNFIVAYPNDTRALGYAENVACVFDNILAKYNLDDKAISTMFIKLKEKIDKFY